MEVKSSKRKRSEDEITEDEENYLKKEKLDNCIHQADWEEAERAWYTWAKKGFISYGKSLPSNIHFNEKVPSFSDDGYGSLCCMLVLLGLISYQKKKAQLHCNVPDCFALFAVDIYVTYTLWLSYDNPLTKDEKKKLKTSFEKCYDFFDKIPKNIPQLTNKSLATTIFMRIFNSGKFAAFWALEDDLHEIVKKSPQIIK